MFVQSKAQNLGAFKKNSSVNITSQDRNIPDSHLVRGIDSPKFIAVFHQQ
jgi:hypothetical protein